MTWQDTQNQSKHLLSCVSCDMKWSVSHCVVLSLVRFTCLFLCHADSEDIASGSGDIPIDVVINSTTTIEPTSTVSNLLVPFSTDVDQPPPSISIYVIPRVSSTLSTSPLLPNTVFGPSTTSSPSAVSPVVDISQSISVSQTSLFTHQTSTLSQLTLSPSPSSLPLVLYIVSLTRVVVIDQQQLGSVLGRIRESLAGLLNLQTTDIFNIIIITQQERTKRQSLSEISFSAIEFSVREVHSIIVEQLQHKVIYDQQLASAKYLATVVLIKALLRGYVSEKPLISIVYHLQLRNGQVATIQLSPAETVQLKDITASVQVSRGQYDY